MPNASTSSVLRYVECRRLFLCTALPNTFVTMAPSQATTMMALMLETGGMYDTIVTQLQRMRQNVANAKVQETGCRTLATRAAENVNHRTWMVEADGITVIVAAMQEHLDCAGLQEAACEALKHLAENHPLLILQSGGQEAIFLAMERHSDHQGVQEQGQQALWNLETVEEHDDDDNRIEERIG